ncbi:helix-turn-helix transcriptional regulator [Phaeobacter gallaeciensis]|uniref:WYL domain-containing protein n=2 Tax=Phaeobacter gallaeciensis TaxID=60890 RepID=A0ABD4XG60_9RHOB|nr:WYL domain-containing protein [Phaeobacter gallaeciensis]MDE4147096.1 WYL domain-containing protein [Phaeobacter gallaeciensis]MDE4159735.1 WYL domain-containing protein [Phaeobacter gallaeciensis]MDE4168189.1 WYL domain-containing protein [Phaeobacter gallaeciensis]MDE4172411.1 WYL domain-containing protein [Phaeobacter gallaeciensis]MDE4214265.1 WYL domain-containing protein [Phaeobacter gallaeciensis]
MKLHPRTHAHAATAKFFNRSASLGRIVLSWVITQALRQELSGIRAMSFQKAQDLLKLAGMSASRHGGITVKEVAEAFSVNERTAQRMIAALKDVFPSISHQTDNERRRRWKLRDTSMLGMQGLYRRELVALEASITRAEREGADMEVDALRSLRDRLVATLPSAQARSMEVDAEAILEAKGYACRPGPKVKTSPAVLNIVSAALRGPFRLIIRYQGALDAKPRKRVIEPYGVLLGTRHYLIARDIAKDASLRRFRMDRIEKAEITNDWFEKDRDFDLESYAARSFGSFHSDEEFTRVVWRFSPAAAPTARVFEFHPKQEMTDLEDGGLLVSFEASGQVEMAWHLAKWGAEVEVVEPAALREMAVAYRNASVRVLP